MRRLLIIASIIVTNQCIAQKIGRQPTTRKIRDSIANVLEQAVKYDQHYRWMCQLGTLDQREIDSLRKLDEKEKFKRMALVGANKVGISKYQKDSLGRLQSILDSVNFVKVSGILYKYGYPHSERDRSWASLIVLHNEDLVDTAFLAMVKQEVLGKRLDAIEYAGLYDRWRSSRHLPKLYYGNDIYDSRTNTFSTEKPTDLEATNKARAEIGLELLKK